MAINLIQNNSELPLNGNGVPITLCDDESKNFLAENIRSPRAVDLDQIKGYCDTYKNQRDALPADPNDFKSKALLAANFLVQDVNSILDQNKGGVLFLRIYLGINETGEHVLCMAPIDMNKNLITTNGTVYTMECCGYPPNGANFKGDPILGL
jgi:hypothetical protein